MFNPLTSIIVADLLADGQLAEAPTAVDMGNQTFGVSPAALSSITVRLKQAAPARRYRIDFAALESFGQAAGNGSGAPLVSDFYRALGFSGYDAIDINSRYGSLVMDLNEDLDAKYGFTRSYDLVVNTGTSEHVFNQAAFLKNAHNLARPGGVMAHVVPFTGYANHGFYNYQPTIFYDLAAANGYEMLRMCLADRHEVLMELMRPNDLAAYFLPYLGLATRNPHGNTFIVALLRRKTGAPFIQPCQGKYVSTLEGEALAGSYRNQGTQRVSMSRFFTPAHPEGSQSRLFKLKKSLRKRLLSSLRSASRFVLMGK